jgi:hypothetical protein
MHRTLVIETVRIGILVTIKIRQEATFISQGMFQCTGALWNFSSKILEVAIICYPFIAQLFAPSGPIFAFPLTIEIPGQWNGFTPQYPVGVQAKQ